MTALEQEVSLAKQQCQDIKQYRLKLYEETDKIEKISIKNIRDKLQKIKTQHQILHQQLKEQRLINQKLTDQLNEYSEHKAKKQKHILKMFSSDFNHDRKIGAPGAAIGGVLGEAFTRNRMKRHLDEGSTGEAIGTPDEGTRRGNSAEKKLTKVWKITDFTL
jgi:superfamily II DNA helicase RecQ